VAASLVVARLRQADKGTILLLALILAITVVGLYDRHQQLKRYCMSIENLKAGQREQAQATIDGNNLLLKNNPDGLPGFPRSVIEADTAAKQRTVDRYPPRPC
jgi:hypothetical protein